MTRRFLFIFLLIGSCRTRTQSDGAARMLRIDYVDQPRWTSECRWSHDTTQLSLRTIEDSLCLVTLWHYHPELWKRVTTEGQWGVNLSVADTLAISRNSVYVDEYVNGVHITSFDSTQYQRIVKKKEKSIVLTYQFENWLYEIEYFSDGWSLSYLLQGCDLSKLTEVKRGVLLRDAGRGFRHISVQ